MSKHLKFLCSAALAISLAAPLSAEDTPAADTVVATVNGKAITLGQMILVRAELPAQYDQFPADALFNGILDQLVQQELLSQSFEGAEPKRVGIALENARLSMMASEAAQIAIDAAVTEEALQAEYDATYTDGTGPAEYNASHILVETLEEAQAVRAKLLEGADFAETAKTESTGPSGPRGGELGWFGTGRMVPEFEAAVVAMTVDAISEPVQTQFGWHIIKLNDKRQSEAPAFEAVREELVASLRERTLSERVSELMVAGTVDQSVSVGIDPALINDYTIVGD